MLDDIDREAEREGMAIKRSFKQKQPRIKKLATGPTQKGEKIDLLELLKVVQ